MSLRLDFDGRPAKRAARGSSLARESAADKGRRYLCEARVTLTYVDAETVTASIRGDGTFHQASYRDGVWSCTCEARSSACSHLVAVRLVTAPDLPGRNR